MITDGPLVRLRLLGLLDSFFDLVLGVDRPFFIEDPCELCLRHLRLKFLQLTDQI
jgi:hypothetical protein